MNFIDEEKIKALIGQKFGKLTVTGVHTSDTGRQIICTVQCECGSEPKDLPLYLLTSGNTKSCGCSRTDYLKARGKKDLVGLKVDKLTILSEDPKTGKGKVKCECGNVFEIPHIRGRIAGLRKNGKCKECKAKEKLVKFDNIEKGTKFGYLTVVRRVENDKNGRAQYECHCQCGNKKIALGRYLVNGLTKSCGCMKKQNFNKIKTLNGLTDTPAGEVLYTIWRRGINFCKNKDIKFFPEWSSQPKGFISFYNWATLQENPFELNNRQYLARIDETQDFNTDNCYFSRENLKW